VSFEKVLWDRVHSRGEQGIEAEAGQGTEDLTGVCNWVMDFGCIVL